MHKLQLSFLAIVLLEYNNNALVSVIIVNIGAH